MGGDFRDVWVGINCCDGTPEPLAYNNTRPGGGKLCDPVLDLLD